MISLALLSLPNTSNVSAYNTANTVKNDFIKVHGDVEKKIMAQGTVDVIIMFDETTDTNTDLSVQNSNKNVNSNINSNVARKNHPKKDSAQVLSNVRGFNKQDDLKIINGYSGTSGTCSKISR